MDEVTLFEDSDGQLVMPLDEKLLAQMGWDFGDKLQWDMHDEHTVYITKKDD